MNRRIIIDIRDYEPGSDPEPLTTDIIESHVTTMLDNDGSDGIVTVTEEASQ